MTQEQKQRTLDEEEVRAKLAEGVHFSLDCQWCDHSNQQIGSNADTYDQALASGWTDIFFEDGAGWNFLGTCPECARQISAGEL